VSEIKNTKYKPTVSVLGSRDQLCIHPEVKLAPSGTKTSKCKIAVKKQKCSYYAEQDNPIHFHTIKHEVMDIEDLVSYGTKSCVCPYYMTQKAFPESDIIFLPYNYILDPVARKSQNIDLNNAIVIFDEGHNIESSCCDVTSFQIAVSELDGCFNEIKQCIQLMKTDGWDRDLHQSFKIQDCQEVQKRISQLSKKVRELNLSKTDQNLTKPGDYIFELLKNVDIDEGNCYRLMTNIESIIDVLSNGAKGSGRFNLSNFNEALKITFASSIATDRSLLKYYRVHIQAKESIIQERGVPKRVTDITVNLWCFSSAVAMREVADNGPRAIIVASGTLVNHCSNVRAPFKVLRKILGLHFLTELKILMLYLKNNSTCQ
jgi:regulator of telomere elongation helicase 1